MPWLIFISTVLPAVVAAVRGVRFQSECQRLAERSAVMPPYHLLLSYSCSDDDPANQVATKAMSLRTPFSFEVVGQNGTGDSRGVATFNG